MAEDLELIRAIVRNRDVACPMCRYNLRDLVTDRCPECEQRLVPSLGLQELRLNWFIMTIIPGTFSGLCALLLGLPMVYATMTGNGPIPAGIVLLDLFGWASGLLTVCLIVRRRSFLSIPYATQRGWALLSWTVHVLVFLLMCAITMQF